MGRRFRRAAGWGVTAVLAVGWLSGCTTTPRSSSAPVSSVATSPDVAAQAQNSTDLKLATTTAAAIQRAFIPPPGARRLAGPPAGTWRDIPIPVLPGVAIVGAAPMVSSLTGHWVVDNSWWRVPGQPQAVIAWVLAHVPAGIGHVGYGAGTPPPVVLPGELAPSSTDKPENVYRIWRVQFFRLSGPPVLDNQQLVIEEMQNGLGRTALLADALVSWIQPKPSAERVPGSASVVTITAVALNGGPWPGAAGEPCPRHGHRPGQGRADRGDS